MNVEELQSFNLNKWLILKRLINKIPAGSYSFLLLYSYFEFVNNDTCKSVTHTGAPRVPGAPEGPAGPDSPCKRRRERQQHTRSCEQQLQREVQLNTAGFSEINNGCMLKLNDMKTLTFSPLGPEGPGGPMGPVRPWDRKWKNSVKASRICDRVG